MKKFIYTLIAFFPVLAFAQNPQVNIDFLTGITQTLGTVVQSLIPIFFGLAIVYFFWGLIKFIQSAGDPEGAAKGKSIMIYGVIAIAIMGSIWGIVGWLQSVFGIQGNTNIKPPTFSM